MTVLSSPGSLSLWPNGVLDIQPSLDLVAALITTPSSRDSSHAFQETTSSPEFPSCISDFLPHLSAGFYMFKPVGVEETKGSIFQALSALTPWVVFSSTALNTVTIKFLPSGLTCLLSSGL